MRTAGKNYMVIHPDLAKNLHLTQGETVKVSSRKGTITIKTNITSKIEKNMVLIPFHFAKEPELKAWL